jgi:hypothetical protein
MMHQNFVKITMLYLQLIFVFCRSFDNFCSLSRADLSKLTPIIKEIFVPKNSVYFVAKVSTKYNKI